MNALGVLVEFLVEVSFAESPTDMNVAAGVCHEKLEPLVETLRELYASTSESADLIL